MILVADAPCHGKNYNEVGASDDYPEDEGLENVVKKLIAEKIFLIVLKVDKSTYKMVETIRKHYEDNYDGNPDDFYLTEDLVDMDLKDINVVSDRISTAVCSLICRSYKKFNPNYLDYLDKL